jgi:predicted  nucleic acid-binding Zn-ribbon protein
MNRKVISLILSLFVLNSCVVFYKTQDIRSTINTNVSQVNQNYSKVKGDYEDRSEIFENLKKSILDLQASSFKTISEKKIALDAAYQNITTKRDEMVKCQQEFEQVVEGKSQIKSNEAEWEKLKEIKRVMKASTSQLNGLGEAYTAKSNSLGDAISNSHYRILEKSQFSKEIKENISALNNSLLDINGQFIVFNQKLQNAYKNGQINDSIYQSKMEITSKISVELNKIKSACKRLKSLESTFHAQYKKQEEIWVGENTKSNALMKRIESKINIIKIAQDEFQSLSNALNPQTE